MERETKQRNRKNNKQTNRQTYSSRRKVKIKERHRHRESDRLENGRRGERERSGGEKARNWLVSHGEKST